MDKNTIRKQTKEKLILFAKENHNKKREVENILLQNFIHSDLYQKAQSIGLTYPLEFEVDIRPLFEKAWSDQKKLYLPKTSEPRKMDFYRFEKNTPLTKSSFNILEPEGSHIQSPENLDLLIVPGIAINSDGYRIGFGGGFFDTFLKNYKGETVGFFFDFQLQNFKPEVFDLPIQNFYIGETQ